MILRGTKIAATHRAIALFTALLLTATLARAQALPTAERALSLSGFGMGTATYTGVEGGKNLSFTAGFDAGLRTFGPIRPVVELRGTIPFDSGNILGEENILAGIKIETLPNLRIHPYADFLFGRGQMHYADPGFIVGPIAYNYTSTNVLSFGGGADLDLTAHFALKADYQFQNWNTPITTSGAAHPQAISIGIVYRINTGRQPESIYRDRGPRIPPPAPATTPLPPNN